MAGEAAFSRHAMVFRSNLQHVRVFGAVSPFTLACVSLFPFLTCVEIGYLFIRFQGGVSGWGHVFSLSGYFHCYLLVQSAIFI